MGCACHIQNSYYDHQSSIKENKPDWMEKIEDGRKVCNITIPGTHDSCARHGGDLVQTQSLSVAAQLNAGIRFLDIRCRFYKNALPIFHGIMPQKIDLTEVLNQVTDFLKTQRTEGIVMSIKEEGDAEDNDKDLTFDQLLQRTCKPFLEFFVTSPQNYPATSVTMGELRGKILMCQRFDGVWPYVAIPYDDLDERYHQDKFRVPTVFAIKDKWNAIEKMLKVVKPDNSFMINFLSGVGVGCYPYTVAQKMNEDTMNWLNEHTNAGFEFGHGIIPADFVSSGLIQSMIDVNFNQSGTGEAIL